MNCYEYQLLSVIYWNKKPWNIKVIPDFAGCSFARSDAWGRVVPFEDDFDRPFVVILGDG